MPVPTWQGPALAPTAALQQAVADVVLVPGLWLSSPDQLQELLMLPRHRSAAARAGPGAGPLAPHTGAAGAGPHGPDGGPVDAPHQAAPGQRGAVRHAAAAQAHRRRPGLCQRGRTAPRVPPGHGADAAGLPHGAWGALSGSCGQFQAQQPSSASESCADSYDFGSVGILKEEDTARAADVR